MKLSKVTIYKYKSYDREQSFSIDDSITIIVGKNESGKTAVLESVAKTNYFADDEDFKFNPTHDYPRKEKKKYDKSGEIGKAVACTYHLDDDEIINIEKFIGSNTVADWEFTVTTKYDNTKCVTHPDLTVQNFLEFIANKYQLDSNDANKLKSATSKNDLLNLVEKIDTMNGSFR